MIVFPRKFVLLVVCVLVSACSGGGNGNGNQSNGNTSGNTASVISINPSSNLLRNDSTITITFNQSIDTTLGSWQISGDLASESNGGVWSSSVLPNDTLTIRPSATWTAKPSRSIIVDATDINGDVIAAFTLYYDIYRGTLYYVDGNRPDDTGDGLNPSTARKYIHTAVADAAPPATVLVNAGEYQVNYGNSTHVVLKGNVSLYGGYNESYSDRSPELFPTVIEDTSTDPGMTPFDINTAILGDGEGDPDTIDSTTRVDGFIIKGTTQPEVSYASAIYLMNGASPTLSTNRIYGGNGFWVAGVISAYGANPVVNNNIIHGGNSTSMSQGIIVASASSTIRNNTIHSGQSDWTEAGILIQVENNGPFALVTIDNNIVYSTAESDSYCIVEYYPQTPNPGFIQLGSLQNNNVFSCNILYTSASGGCSGTCTLDEINSLPNVIDGVGNNISVAVNFDDIDGLDDDLATMDDNNWYLSASNPSSITSGGLNGYDQSPAWSFTNDAAGNSRPASGNPWSIGAYELR